MTQQLSPAAQAIHEAFGRYPLRYEFISHDTLHGALPAAIRAAADQVVPAHLESFGIRKQLLSIADELEAQ
jgi:hypothetical protein